MRNIMHPNAKFGEDIVVKLLIQKGFEILKRNFYWCKHEVDIIAKRNGIIYLFEVKYVTNIEFLKPRAKQIEAYENFIHIHYANEEVKAYFAIVHKTRVEFLPMNQS